MLQEEDDDGSEKSDSVSNFLAQNEVLGFPWLSGLKRLCRDRASLLKELRLHRNGVRGCALTDTCTPFHPSGLRTGG